MKKILLFLLLANLFFPSLIKAEGEIEINSWTELEAIGTGDSYPCNGSYILTRDLTSSDPDYATVAGLSGDFQSICSSGNDFSGIFDGQNHKLYDLVINRESASASLFGDLEGATIKNLSLIDADISGDSYYVGGLSQRTYDTTIENVHITGEITNDPESYDCTGGLVGNAEETTTIFKSSANITISGSQYVGGLVGCANLDGNSYLGVTISQSYSAGQVSTTFGSYAGGLIGIGRGSVIADSYSTAQVTSASDSAGGLAGALLIADAEPENFLDSFIYNSYATGQVTASDYAGGLVGAFSGSNTAEDTAMYDSFATGRVSVTGEYAAYVGGLTGYLSNFSNPSISNSYWYDGYGYGENFSCYIIGEGELANNGCTAITNLSTFKDTAVLVDIATLWDFEGLDAVWKTVSSDYPQLFWQVDEAQPTPTSTPSFQNQTSSSSSPGWSAPNCTDSAPVLTPDLFQVNTTSRSAKLFFTPIDTDQFWVSFSTKPDAEMYGEQVNLLREGVQSHNIYHLKPNTIYYIKVRGQNSCMPGNWSNTMKFKTNNQIYYKNFSPTTSPISNLVTELSSKNTSTITPTPKSETTLAPTQPSKTVTSPQTDSQANTQHSKKCFLWWCW